MRQGLTLALSTLLLLALSQASLAASTSECQQLTGLELDDTNITAAEVVATNTFRIPGSDKVTQLPAFCRVVAVTQPAINFEVWLPMENWNGNYQGVGNGGMAGRLSYTSMAGALRHGSATASTDTGHTAGPIPFDATWASGRPDLIEDFGHRALHFTTVNGKAVAEAFYREPPKHAYFWGCSKGGQQAMMEAQRYPDDFDGIIAGNPAMDWTQFYAGAHLWYSQAMLVDEKAWIPPAKLPALGNAVNAACDAKDGIEDGILMDPRNCDFDPRTLVCSPETDSGTDNDSCLTQVQAEAVTKIWSGTTDSRGELIYPGLVPGGEAGAGSWARWVTGPKPFGSLHWLGGEGFFRWFVFNDANWDFRTFDYDDDLTYALEKVGSAVDADNPDLRPFRDHGGKLILYHGWSDPDISPLASITYFDKAVDVIGKDTGAKSHERALASTQDFFRLFMVPGMGHCRGGPGPDTFDPLTALENWVENGIAPDAIAAAKIENGKTVRTRPLCPYPEIAIYDGSGNTDEAVNFTCAISK